ncbi:MAG TPA: sulfite exporter TauE/SafE family protein [Clostridia bacterium]|nr:sulfite exporter TauE/SafE family protein [Clostridia bacterium]
METGAIRTTKLHIDGMTCISCQNKIEKKLRNTAGVQNANVSYNAGTAVVAYNPDIISIKNIVQIIQKLGYQASSARQKPNTSRTVGLLIIIVALYVLLEQFGVLNLLAPSQLAQANMGYGMLFVIGLITSVHCVAMCGGINLSQCIQGGVRRPDQVSNAGNTRASSRNRQLASEDGQLPKQDNRASSLRPAFLYNLGRVISYTVVGFIVGALGSVINFSSTAQGVLKLIAGVFMVIMGVNMLGIFPWLRKLTPRMPKIFARKINSEKSKSNSPLFVGLLNGLMPCGPLQAMQIYALSTGNPFAGALSMLLFSLGTVPLMFGLGALSSVLSKKFTRKVAMAGAVLVVVLGLSMFTQGWGLSGLSLGSVFPRTAAAASQTVDSTVTDGVQVVRSELSSGKYPAITVQAGIPVKWIINAPEGSINGCNNRMLIPEYDIEHEFKTGENIIEFTPTTAGTFSYSCWMGMIRSTISVTEGTVQEAAAGDSSKSSVTDASGPVPAGYKIPVDNVAVAEKTTIDGSAVQNVTVELTKDGFNPAVVVVESGLDVVWNIQNQGSDSARLLVPVYAAQLSLVTGDNRLFFTPGDNFDFSTGDNAFYGYVYVVDDIDTADLSAIKAEVSQYETLIWPPETFAVSGAATNGTSDQAVEATVKDGVQYVTSSVSSGGYQPITVQQGIPVKWTLSAAEGSLNGCNNSIVIPEYDLKIDLKTGDTLIEFIPTRSGTFAFSCWMGMVRSTITVLDENGAVAPNQDDGSDQLPSCCG